MCRDGVDRRELLASAMFANVKIEYAGLREALVVFDGVAEAVRVALPDALLKRLRLQVHLQPLAAASLRADVPVYSFGGTN